jgi:hypothetical protein
MIEGGLNETDALFLELELEGLYRFEGGVDHPLKQGAPTQYDVTCSFWRRPLRSDGLPDGERDVGKEFHRAEGRSAFDAFRQILAAVRTPPDDDSAGG